MVSTSGSSSAASAQCCTVDGPAQMVMARRQCRRTPAPKAGTGAAAAARWLVALTASCCALAIATAGEPQGQGARYHRSSSLGITHCSLPGVLGGEDVTLHLWLRLVPPGVAARALCAQRGANASTCGRTAIVRGFAFLQSARRSVPFYNKAGIQLLQAASIKHFSRLVFLRSIVTGALYPIRVLMSFGLNPAMNGSTTTSDGHVVPPFLPLISQLTDASSTSTSSSPGRSAGSAPAGPSAVAAAAASAMLSNPNTTIDDDPDATCSSNRRVKGRRCSHQGFTSHVMDLVGHVHLRDGDLDMQDFEVRVIGFDWYCPVLVEPPVLGRRQQAGRAPRATGEEAASGWGRQQQEQHSSSGGSGWLEWTHHLASSLSARTQVWQVLAPFHGMDIRQYAILLWHRVLWHSQMGIHKYLLYVYESLSPLMREPLIQDLVAQGYLEVVFFNEMPKHEERVLQRTLTDIYINQVVAYNHALLALWGGDVVALVADVDEYIVTPQPTSMVQVFKTCRNLTLGTKAARKRPLAGLQIRRTDATCAPGASPSQCSLTAPGLPAWTSVQPADVMAGRAEHPLSWHALTDGRDMWLLHNTKMLVDPNLSRDYHVHFFRPMRGALRDWGNTSCVRVLHLVDLYRVRPGVLLLSRGPGGEGGAGEPHARGAADPSLASWWWPSQAVRRGFTGD